MEKIAGYYPGTRIAFSNVPKVGQNFVVRCFSNCIVFAPAGKILTNLEPPERQENDITGFSAQSRKRLFEIFAKLDYESYGVPVFVSATYHYDAPTERAHLKNKIQSYFRILKRILPPFHYITKLEYQQRGVPHFHFILLPLDKNTRFDTDEIMNRLRKHWLSLKDCKCKHCQTYAVKTVGVKDYKHAVIYISKEIAKVTQNYQEHDLGRIWSTSQGLRIREFYNFETDTKFYDEILRVAISKVRQNTKSELYLKSLRWTFNPSTLFISLKDIEALILKELKKQNNDNKLELKKTSLKYLLDATKQQLKQQP